MCSPQDTDARARRFYAPMMKLTESEKRLVRPFGAALRKARLDLGLTQQEAAEKAGVTREYWGHVEGSGRNLTLLTMHRFCLAVRADLFDVLVSAREYRKTGGKIVKYARGRKKNRRGTAGGTSTRR